MTYARSRLWLGISGVGSIVVISSYLLVSRLPLVWLPDDKSWSSNDLLGLLAVIGSLAAIMLPLDLLGGYLLPNRSRPNTITGRQFFRAWIRGVAVQGSVFLVTGLVVLAAGRAFGWLGAALAVLAVGVVLLAFQLPIARFIASLPKAHRDQSAIKDTIARARRFTAQWGWNSPTVVVLDHHDTGFTGGIVGLPGRESVVVPYGAFTNLTPEQLAVAIARRAAAIQSGSRTRGVVLALGWVTIGFALSSFLPGAGVTSVGQLAMTCLGFTLWTFLGLLTLPTLSRQASYAIDRRVIEQGASDEILHETVQTLDRLQDDEPERSRLVETIFHPVPSVQNRRNDPVVTQPIAWHAARMTLFVSWACMGMLVRAVHCNAGRPELWVMLPTD